MAESTDGGTIIGADTVIKGEMSLETKAKILGRFEGSIRAKGQVEVAEKAHCEANVDAAVVAVDGMMQGNINASQKVQLNSTARLKGDVVAAKLAVSEGAAMDGHFRIGPDALSKGGGGAASGAAGGGKSDSGPAKR